MDALPVETRRVGSRIRHLHEGGTRVRLFPEYGSGYREPETVRLSPPPGTVGIGPEDGQFYVANAVGKSTPYGPPNLMPPWTGAEYQPAAPDAAGHFDHLEVGSPQFAAAHMYGSARHTLDIWEHYLGRSVTWWHAPSIPRLELVPVVIGWANAHSGPGFLETGEKRNRYDRTQQFWLNFDIIAHEVGHAVLFAEVGVPGPGRLTGEYLAFHESFADLFGLIGALRFESVITRLLDQTGGNLYVLNLVTRLGKYSDTEQVRIASTEATMADVAGIRLRPDGNWDDPTGRSRNQHALGEPLTGAIFDGLAEIYQDRLVARGLIPREADPRGWTRADVAAAFDGLHLRSAAALARFRPAFELALLEARDVIGLGMAHAIETLHPETLSFGRVAARMLERAWSLGEGANVRGMLGHFLRHGIDPRPFLVNVGTGRAQTLRFVDPDPASAAPRTRDPLAYVQARRAMPHLHREIPS